MFKKVANNIAWWIRRQQALWNSGFKAGYYYRQIKDTFTGKERIWQGDEDVKK